MLVDKEGGADWQPLPENCIPVPPWDGNDEDTVLLDLIPVLESMALPDIPDVRPLIKQHKESELGLVESFKLAQVSSLAILPLLASFGTILTGCACDSNWAAREAGPDPELRQDAGSEPLRWRSARRWYATAWSEPGGAREG